MHLGIPGHSYALLPSTARRLSQLAGCNDARSFAELMDDLLTGRAAGLVCARCGMSMEEIIAANVLSLETSPLSSTVCTVRRATIETLMTCDLAGMRPAVCYDVLREMTDTFASPPRRRSLVATMRAATSAKLQSLMVQSDGRLPILGQIG